MAHTDVQEILGTLKDVDFPAGKDDLLRAARTGGASEEALKALRGIPPDRYANRDEVARSVRVDPDSDLGHSAAQRAQQARKGGKPGLSQHLRDADKPPVQDELDR
ncbi:DUF2795 domain-containing protein [Streptomyces sp. TRM 70361]|uniref:DUF2795 domain-containing protein n=1 Tax=Streptomyces sp. TRM 70361 TaxID=3116553 RepID=UPI002E7B4519|nr:DUF2795 domain-containing protein [Streptomyces sp. TRM 70361]MEE1938693.1 DUF2795 domain-containing protein [Streptomyces sp. TRM 70361]